MTTTETTSGLVDDQREQARQAWRQAAAAGTELTGRQLGEMYSMSERWGRARIEECRSDDATPASPRPLAAVVPFSENPAAAPSASSDSPSLTPALLPTPAPADVSVPVWVRRVTVAAATLVAVVAAVVSYEHMRHLAAGAGEGWRSILLPLAVDGLMVAASMVMLVRRRQGRTRRLATAALVLGIVASLAANIAAAEPTTVARVIAAWPPLALLVTYELLMQLIRPQSRHVDNDAPSTTTPTKEH